MTGHLAKENKVSDIINHPAFIGFSNLLLPRNDNTPNYNTLLSNVGSLMPYHSHVVPDDVVGAINYMIDEVNDGKKIFYNFYTDEQKKLMPPVIWPLVDRHPGSGRKVLFVGVHARQIVGLSTAESRLLLSDLLEHATQRERVDTHTWQVSDLVMWDNRVTVHRGRRYDLSERRELRRTTVNDTPEAMLAVA